jgi:hypothetical protein
MEDFLHLLIIATGVLLIIWLIMSDFSLCGKKRKHNRHNVDYPRSGNRFVREYNPNTGEFESDDWYNWNDYLQYYPDETLPVGGGRKNLLHIDEEAPDNVGTRVDENKDKEAPDENNIMFQHDHSKCSTNHGLVNVSIHPTFGSWKNVLLPDDALKNNKYTIYADGRLYGNDPHEVYNHTYNNVMSTSYKQKNICAVSGYKTPFDSVDACQVDGALYGNQPYKLDNSIIRKIRYLGKEDNRSLTKEEKENLAYSRYLWYSN